MNNSRINAARERARADAASPTSAPADGRPRTIRAAIGDPQAAFETFLQVLDAHSLLGADGRLAPHVHLVSMGDHFDWGAPPDRDRAAESALQLLSWLAAHPEDQVTLLLGNHDLGRVCELADFDLPAFFEAQAQADRAYRGGDPDPELESDFLARYPHLPSSELIARDFSTFRPEQRALVTQLLRARRFRVAYPAAEDLLLCHAGVTRDDLDLAGVPPAAQRHAPDVAAALNAKLDEAVSRWRGGALHLEPLHQPGHAGRPAGRGIFYQRPACPEGEPSDDFEGPPRRRFDPHLLPGGLVQAVGHIRDRKCRRLLAGWARPEAACDGPLRFLRVEHDHVTYARGLPAPGEKDAATMLFLDGAMAFTDPRNFELLDLDARRPLRRP